MTTTATEAPPAEATTASFEFVSPYRSLWVSIETNVDDYGGLGGMRTVKRGTRAKFSNGRYVTSDPAMNAALRAHSKFGLDFFAAEDRSALRGISAGPEVASGQRHTRMTEAVDEPPLPGWDEMGPREIREALAAGKVADPVAANAYEGAHRARAQVLASIGKAIRESRGDEAETGEPEAEAGEGYVRPDNS